MNIFVSCFWWNSEWKYLSYLWRQCEPPHTLKFFVQINWSFGFFTQWHLGGKVQLPTRSITCILNTSNWRYLIPWVLQMLLYGGRRSHLKQLYLETTTMFFFDSDLFRWYSTGKLELRSFLFIQPYTNSWGEEANFRAEGNPHKCMDWVVKPTVHEGLLIGIGGREPSPPRLPWLEGCGWCCYKPTPP